MKPDPRAAVVFAVVVSLLLGTWWWAANEPSGAVEVLLPEGGRPAGLDPPPGLGPDPALVGGAEIEAELKTAWIMAAREAERRARRGAVAAGGPLTLSGRAEAAVTVQLAAGTYDVAVLCVGLGGISFDAMMVTGRESGPAIASGPELGGGHGGCDESGAQAVGLIEVPRDGLVQLRVVGEPVLAALAWWVTGPPVDADPATAARSLLLPEPGEVARGEGELVRGEALPPIRLPEPVGGSLRVDVVCVGQGIVAVAVQAGEIGYDLSLLCQDRPAPEALVLKMIPGRATVMVTATMVAGNGGYVVWRLVPVWFGSGPAGWIGPRPGS